MADGKVEIDVELNDSKAKSQATKAGQQISKGVESGLKGATKAADSAAKGIEKPLTSAANAAKSSFSSVGSSAKSSFSGVADAAKTSSSDAVSAFETIPADAAGAFSDVSSEAQSGFSGVADAADAACSDAAESFEQVGDAATDAGDEANNAFSVKMVAAGNIAADAIEQLISKLGEFIQSALEAGMSFDKSMAQVAATMGVAVSDIGELNEFAQEMGRTTAFSASEAADALNYMALAGYDASTSMRVLPTVLNLAAAGSIDLAAASDMVTDAQSALGLSVEEAEVMVDQMAKTSSKTNTSVEQLGNAFLTVGGTAKSLKGGTAELAQMLGILADNGIKGSEGGTALRNVILSLSAPTDTARAAIERLGLSVFDAEGNMRAMPDIFNDLNAAMEPLTQQERTEILNTIFNKVDLKSVNALLGTSATRFDEVAAAIDNAQGSAQQMAETQLDNLAGDVTLLESAVEGFYIAVSNNLTPALRELAQFAANIILPALTEMANNFDQIAPYIAAAAASIALFVGYRKLMKTFADETRATSTVVKLLGREFTLTGNSAKVASVGMSAASKATTAAGAAMRTLGSAMKTVLPLLVMTAAIEGIMALVDAFQNAEEEAKTFEKATDGLRNAFEGVDKAAVDSANALNSYSTDKPRRAMSDLKSSIDDAIKSQAELAESISKEWTDINTNSALLETYIGTIKELTNAYDENGNKRKLEAEEQAALVAAVSGYNEITGDTVNVIDAVNGILDVSTAKLNENADAWINNAKKQAAQEELVDLAKERLQLEKDFGEASTARAKAIEYKNKAIKEGIPLTESELMMISESEDAYNKAEEALRANGDAQQWLTDQIKEADDALKSSASAISEYIKGNESLSKALKDSGVDVDALSQKLSDLGFSTTDLVSLSEEKLLELAGSYEGSASDIVAVCDRLGITVPQKLRDAAQGGADAVSAVNDQMIVDVGKDGEDAGEAEATGLESKKDRVSGASNTLKTEVENPLSGLGDSATIWGRHISTNLAIGIMNTSDQVTSAVGNIASIIKGRLGHTVPEEGPLREGGRGEIVWGEHLVENIIQGMTNAIPELQSTANGIATIVSDAMQTDLYVDASGSSVSNGLLDVARSMGAQIGEMYSDGVEGETPDASKAGLMLKSATILELDRARTEAYNSGVNAGLGFIDGMRSQLAAIRAMAAEMANAATAAIRKAGQEGSPWKTTIRSGEFAAQGLIVGFERVDPMRRIGEIVSGGMSRVTQMASTTTNVYHNERSTTNNINQPVKSPDEFMRAIKLQEQYGLAVNAR